MWYLLRLLFVGPPSKTVEAPLRRRLNDLEADVEQLQSHRESQRGQILTLQRRAARLERELWDEDYEDEDEELDDLLAARKQAQANG